MKSLKESLFDSKTQTTESLFDNDLVERDILYHPRTRGELIKCIDEQLKLQGPNANLNIIDVSQITDMSGLFDKIGILPGVSGEIKNIDISLWNTSRVKNMSYMFCGCKSFNSDLSKWDVSNVSDMTCMFANCEQFNSDLSKWDVSKVKSIRQMFQHCYRFNSDLSKWDVSNVRDKYGTAGMFLLCFLFKSDLSK